MKYLTWIIVLVVVIWGGWALLSKDNVPAVDASPIKLGFMGPLTGDLANMGANAKAAVEIAVEELNSSGGINGRNIEVIFEDDQCEGASAASAISKLTTTDKVSAVVGPTCSGATLGAAPVAEAAKTVLLAFCATADTVSAAGDYIFRDVPKDSFQAKFAADYLYSTGKRKAAILYVNNDWGVGLDKAFAESFKALGGSIVADESYAPDSKDLRTQLTKIKSSGADVLYFAGFPDGTIAALKQAKELGVKALLFGADAWDDTRVWTEAGTAGEGAMYTVAGTNSSEDFKAKMKAKLGSDDVIYCSNYAYDAVKVLAQVMAKVGTDSTMIKDELYKTTYTGGVASASISFDQNGDPTTANYVIKVVKDGKADVVGAEPAPTDVVPAPVQ
ncbi:MAG TPA: penicillin-binding protein activator [Candidatus Paceibacterota bacterium]